MGPENVQVAFESGCFTRVGGPENFQVPLKAFVKANMVFPCSAKVCVVFYKRQWPASVHDRVRSFVRMHRANANVFPVCCVLQYFVAQRVIKIHCAAARKQQGTKL